MVSRITVAEIRAPLTKRKEKRKRGRKREEREKSEGRRVKSGE